jgi:SAM-dependent methyltransferase
MESKLNSSPKRGPSDPFLQPKLVTGNLDRYFVRSSILREIQAIRSSLKGRILDVGCGQKPYRNLLLSSPSQVTDYVGIDLPTEKYGGVEPEVIWDGIRMPLEDSSFDCTIATEVLEHCPDPRIPVAEIHRILRPGGCFFFTVPFLWPLHEVPFDEYRYTPFALKRILSSIGFENVDVWALGGWNASLAQMLGLWVRRRPMKSWQRAIASRLFMPIIRWLIRSDVPPKVFSESTMITGLAGIGWKSPTNSQKV